jgi:hypothetical protein
MSDLPVPARLAPGPHPAGLADAALLAECRVERLRRSGPGGQRRNKVETGVRLKHLPSGLSSEATERRSSRQNLQAAVERLRWFLALHIRRPPGDEPTPLWKQRARGGRITVSPSHPDLPVLAAEALDTLAAADWNHQQAAARLEITPTQLVRLLSLEPRALDLLNQSRVAAGLIPLRR